MVRKGGVAYQSSRSERVIVGGREGAGVSGEGHDAARHLLLIYKGDDY